MTEIKKPMEDLEKGLAYVKASLGMEGFTLSEKSEELLRQYGNAQITRKEVIEAFKGM
ncbi:antitoxin VbhA family protein [Lysinibacillus fusiformis]|uniref:Antitoxin VbhA domain-containing protein n=1 Tax=Lysinibacillus fusiformis TaxID=28031 RepID=A0A1H9SNF7_9BACI|nr:antitoxin VbhA family protein [Lysinibacillus fusiformis]SCY84934.1 hypothetical protein SAMN02787081_04769 [Lysinibacillus fusiformis]SEO52831.1 hypothetical protein SAMN02787103_04645 [Lysinibacillus fusiformis]SER86471.1 hypothetical protein SAMN02787113_04774 [Lysinibacillus fusiformis]